MRISISTARAILAAGSLLAIATVAQAGPPMPAQNGVPQPKILVIDRQAILLRSAAGQSIMQQAHQLAVQAQADLKNQAAAIRAQGAKLQQQLAIMSADVKEQKERAYEQQRASFEQLAQQKQSMIQGGVFAAREQIASALGPILKGIMMERGANMLVDKNAVVFSTVDVDVTPIAIQRLNQKLSTVKVTLSPLPPGVQPQAE